MQCQEKAVEPYILSKRVLINKSDVTYFFSIFTMYFEGLSKKYEKCHVHCATLCKIEASTNKTVEIR